jgi:hypothetical protein
VSPVTLAHASILGSGCPMTENLASLTSTSLA